MNVVPAGSSCSATATASAASSAIDDDGVTIAPVTIATAGYYSVCATATTPTGYSALVGDITVTQRATIGWTYVLDPEEPGSVEIISQAQTCTSNTCKNAKKLNWKKDRIMILDCKATCGISSPAKGVSFEQEPAALKEANEFVAQNDMFDAAATARTMVDLPSELRTYMTVKSHFCKGGNIPGSELMDSAADHGGPPLGASHVHDCEEPFLQGRQHPGLGADGFSGGLVRHEVRRRLDAAGVLRHGHGGLGRALHSGVEVPGALLAAD